MKHKLFWLFGWILCALLSLLCLEVVSEVAYRLENKMWYFEKRRTSGLNMIQLHPYFGACNIPNVVDERNGVRIAFNSFRIRGPEFARPKPPGIIRIAALGGSTTFCVGVSENETWERRLNEELGTNYEVINMGAPGGTSVETMIQSALLFSEVQPDVALFYLGWNDTREQHIKDLQPDYFDYHGKWMLSFGLNGRDMKPRTALGYLIRRLAFHYFFPRMDIEFAAKGVSGGPGALTDQIDAHAINLYERNLGLISAICRQQGVRAIFMPQFLNYEILTSDKPYGSIPFVRDRDLKKVMAAYNESLAKVAKQQNIGYLGEVLEPNYTQDDFTDNGHLSNDGNKRLAHAIYTGLQRLGVVNTNSLINK